MDSLKEVLSQKISECNIEQLVSSCGYNNFEKGIEKINSLMNHRYFGLLDSEGYDLVHSNSTLLKKLCSVLNISKELYEKEAYAIRSIAEFYKRAAYKHIHIHTKRDINSARGIALMAFNSQTRIDNFHYLETISMDKQIEEVSKVVRDNFKRRNGKIDGLGIIAYYSFHYEEGRQPIYFDSNGKIIER